MLNREKLIEQIRTKKSFLCVGIDPETDKLPPHLLKDEDPLYEFSKNIVDATADYCVAFKPNTAFFEAYGLNGMESLSKTFRYIKTNYPDHLLIADAKRGDIGNTSDRYAKAFFKRFEADAITVSPYMGADSVKPFLQHEGKWTIVLALTSNPGASDFQQLKVDGRELYLHVLEKSSAWGTDANMMFVVGATRAEMLSSVRQVVPSHFLLVPGVGAQGGSLREVCECGLNRDIGLLVNASRSIIYASSGNDYASAAAGAARSLAEEMSAHIGR